MDPVLVLLVGIVFLVLAYNAVKIVRQYERLVVFRLGNVIGEMGPGPVWLWPIVDRAVRVDLREQFLEVPSQTCITKDNAPIAVDFLIYWRVMNPTDSTVQVANFQGAVQGIAMTTLRAVVGDIPLDDVLARRDHINQVLQVKLAELKITESHSRPRVSNDNAHVESLFRTLKYVPIWPEKGFSTLEEARAGWKAS